MKKLKLYVDTSVLGGLFDIEDVKRLNTVEMLLRSEIISPEEVTGDGEMEI